MASPIALLVGGRLMALTLGVVLAAAAALTALSFPDSIAYTAAPFAPGYRVATDSNVDWGQDFSLLTQWSRGRHPRVAYFGPRGITNADIPGARRLIGVAPGDISGWVAVSATDLTSALRDDGLSWLRAYCPVGTLGGSILLYHFTTPPKAAPGPSTPARCVSRRGKSPGGRVTGRDGGGVGQESTLRRKFRSPSVMKIALKANSAG